MHLTPNLYNPVNNNELTSKPEFSNVNTTKNILGYPMQEKCKRPVKCV